MQSFGFQALIRLFHLLDHRAQPAAQGIACLICDLQHAGVAVLHRLDAGGHVRDTADGQHLHTQIIADHGFRHGAHAHSIGPHARKGTDLGGRFIAGTHEAQINTLLIGNAQLIGGLAKKAGASLLVMSRIDDRQTGKAREIGDFDAYVYGNAPDRAERMRELSEGGFDVVFEAVGSGDSLAACLDGVKPGGEVVMIGNSVSPTVPFELNRAVLHEVRLTGSVSCTRREFEETIDLIARGIIDPEKYVTDVLPLEELQHALEMQVSAEGLVLKTVIRP